MKRSAGKCARRPPRHRGRGAGARRSAAGLSDRIPSSTNFRRRRLASLYRRLLSRGFTRGAGRDARRLVLPSEHALVLPSEHAGAGSHVFHLYVVRHPERERLRAHLAARGVETLVHYPAPLHLQPLFRRRGQLSLPAAEAATREIFSLPLYPQLRDEEVREVAEAVLEFSDE